MSKHCQQSDVLYCVQGYCGDHLVNLSSYQHNYRLLLNSIIKLTQQMPLHTENLEMRVNFFLAIIANGSINSSPSFEAFV